MSNYRGYIPRPPWAKWQAVDPGGAVLVFEAKPEWDGEKWSPPDRTTFMRVNLCLPHPEPSTTLEELS